MAGMVTAAILMVRYFGRTRSGYIRDGVVTGLFILAINYALDLVVLVGLLRMQLPGYVASIGVRYLAIPVFVIAAGVIAERASRNAGG